MTTRMPLALSLFSALSLVSASPAFASADPVTLVDPLIGTTAGADDFPGADVPFGMVQWSPDTPKRPPGGGYDYTDASITGFSLTHLSGPGCLALGDFPILPTIGAVTDPAHAAQPFSHQDEQAAPGYYAVMLGPQRIGAEFTVTTHAGIARFTYPATTAANVLVDVAGSQAGDSDSHFHVDSPTEISGSATGGHFCGSPDEFTVYFVAEFDRPMTSFGAWSAERATPGLGDSSGPAAGGWATFDATGGATIKMKVGVSFVGIEGARANLQTEILGWDFDAVRAQAVQAWRIALSRIAIDGGTPSEQRVFYTALYHALLHPNVFSDADGTYEGFDGRVHRVAAGHAEYANYSGWDIYRTELPLLALLVPHETSDMMQSLIDDARDGGWLPKWPLANTYTDAMNGDQGDPMLADAYAFGARDFDTRAALAAMVRGATPPDAAPGQGWYVERPDLGEYLSHGYVTNTHTNSVSPLPNSASETLEYALDDFCISRFAA
ncbi:MAG TPA: GH92 family glycosyl hydrolase, partial [Candidatus Eremiobacteraceae bacterium]|nr:GH92 family glycosyl hydrolase [Candidatus Eremiobacteraceae bacterium]